MNWYLQSGRDSDVVKSTQICLLRNVNGFKFNLSDEERTKLEENIKEHLFEIGYGLQFLKIKDMDEITRKSLVEKNLITKECSEDNKRSILINDDENICIMIGGEDHLSIQVFSTGLELESTLNLAIEVESKIGEFLEYNISEKYGYLTSCPNSLGTALKANVILYLPALSKTKNTKRVLNAIDNFGITITELEGEKSGYIYQIANKQTLGITEKDIIQNIQIIVNKIIQQERQARKYLAEIGIQLEDKIYRNYGILSNCKRISDKEVLELLSDIKIGTDLGILKELTDLKVQKIYLFSKPGNLQKILGNKYETDELDIKRAEFIRQIIGEK